MAEPMDLSDTALQDKVHRYIDVCIREASLPHIKIDWLDLLEQRITAAMATVRDAATAAERQRAIAIVERQPYYPDTHTGMRQQWVKDQILAALRGGET